MYKDIEQMLDEGMTPEKLYQEALRIVEAKNAAAARINKEKIMKTRTDLLAAIINYVEAVTQKPIDKDFLKDTEDLLRGIEKNVVKISLKKEEVPQEKKCKCKCSSQKTDDEKLIEFLKLIGAMP